MKITRKELDPSILTKLDQLDNVKVTFDNNNGDGFVSYGPAGFFFKKTNDTFLKRVYTEDEFVDLEESLRKNRRNVRSSLLEDMRADNKFNNAAKKFLYKIPFSFRKDFSGKILIKEKVSSGVLFLLSDGNLVKYDGDRVESLNIVSLISEAFNLSSQFSVYSFVDIAEIDINTFLVATTNFGIYKVSFTEKSAELICILNLVRDIEYTHTGNLFVATDEFCAQYELKSGKRIEKYANLLNQRHLPKKIIKTEDGLFVLAIPAGIQNNNNLLHYWKLDKARLGYNCCDDMVSRHSFDNAYQVLEDWVDSKYLYLSGKLGNHKLFVWKYDLATMDMEEIIIDCLDITTYDGFLCISDNYVFLTKNMLYIVRDNEVIGNFVLGENCQGLYTFKGEFYTTFRNNFGKFLVPSFETKSDKLSYVIFDGSEDCNNIDIFVGGATKAERLTLYDMDTNREILVSYHIVYKNNSIIKLMNCTSKRIKLVIDVSDKSKLEGIVVKSNKMFLR